MHQALIQRDFDSWRTTARRFLAQQIPPEQILWQDVTQAPLLSLPTPASEPSGEEPGLQSILSPNKVPRAFLPLAQLVSCHRDPNRWPLLYRLLWRVTHTEPNLLELLNR